MEFAGELYFNSPSEPGHNTSPTHALMTPWLPRRRRTPPIDPRSPQSHLSDLRICANDISIGVSGGSFTNDPAQQPSKNRAWRAAQRLPNLERRIADRRQAHGALRAQGRRPAAAADGLGTDTGRRADHAATGWRSGWGGGAARQFPAKRGTCFSPQRRRSKLDDHEPLKAACSSAAFRLPAPCCIP